MKRRVGRRKPVAVDVGHSGIEKPTIKQVDGAFLCPSRLRALRVLRGDGFQSRWGPAVLHVDRHSPETGQISPRRARRNTKWEPTIKQVDCAFRERSADTLSALTTIPSGQECPRSPTRRLQAFEERRPPSLAPKGLATLTQYEILKLPIRPIRSLGISRGSGVPPVPVLPRAGNPAGFSKTEFLTEPEDPDLLPGRRR